MKMLTILGKRHTIHEIYFQDPAFAAAEEEFFHSLGITVLYTPDAFSKITPTTLVFAPFVKWLIPRIFKGCYPAVFFGTGLADGYEDTQAVLEGMGCRESSALRMPKLAPTDPY